MGCFSWMYANSDNTRPLMIGKRAYVPVPNETTNIFEPSYDGYGHFGRYDIYDLVAQWNKDYLTEENLIKPEREEYSEECYYISAMERFQFEAQRILDFKVLTDEEMKRRYGKEYLREIGISIACDDEQNRKLKYPIKICSCISRYEDEPASNSDPGQGFGYY